MWWFGKAEPSPDIVAVLRLKDCNLVHPHKLSHWSLTTGWIWLLLPSAYFEFRSLLVTQPGALINQSSLFTFWEIACECQDESLIIANAWMHCFRVPVLSVLWSPHNPPNLLAVYFGGTCHNICPCSVFSYLFECSLKGSSTIYIVDFPFKNQTGGTGFGADNHNDGLLTWMYSTLTFQHNFRQFYADYRTIRVDLHASVLLRPRL